MNKSFPKYRVAALPLALAALLSAHTVSAEDAVYYSTDFNTSSLSSIGFTALDANGDGQTWTPQTSKVTFRSQDGQSITAVDKTPTFVGNYENDDWLITPSIRFEAGKTYNVEFVMCKLAYAPIDDAYEVKLGTAKNAASMTVELMPLSEGDLPQWGGNSLWTKKFVVKVDATADYFMGIHATGKPGQRFGIADLKIAPGVALVTPAAVTDLKLTPDAGGDKTVTITFTAPDKAKNGDKLDALTKIEVRRNGDLVKTIESPQPGTPQSVTDLVAVSSIYTYSVTAFTANGGGDAASASTFIGINTPAAAANVVAANTGNRSAHITWDVPALDKDGYPIASSLISYDVYRKPIYSSEKTLVAENLSATEYTDSFEAPQDDIEAPQQQFYSYSVVAKTIEGEATEANANCVPMGEPYAVPYLESFPNGRASTIFTSEIVKGNNYWSQSSNFEEVSAVDGDNGMIYLNGQIGGAARYLTGLIDLAGMPSPTLNYYTYNIKGADPADHTLQVTVMATDGTVKEFENYAPEMGWTKTILRLDEFTGKTIRVIFNGYRNNNTELHLDAVAVSNIYRHDLKAAAIHVPEKVRSSEPFDVLVDVVNAGSDVTGKYTVELYCNAVKVDSYEGDQLAVGAYNKLSFNRTHAVTDPEKAVYYAKVIYADDQDQTNNQTEEVETTVRKNSYPVVADLTGVMAGSTVNLTWSEPDTEKAQPYEVTDDFESYQAWATSEVGDWTFVDRDGATIAGFVEGVMPGIPSYSKQSWWVFDNAHEDFNNGSFRTLSGHQFLASMVSGIKGEGYVQNDDWAISPELYGGPQTIIVNARSYSLDASALESFEVLYSTGSLNPDDFVSVSKHEEIPNDFAAYEFDLPDGAKYFAVRNISLGKYVLMVDDVCYIPAGDPAAFSINGYNVYRDGVRINAEPVEENEYADLEAPAGNHNYQVSVLYSAGESQLSNIWTSTNTGVEGVATDNTEAPVYYNLQGLEVSKPRPGQPYIVRRGNEVRKIVVR